MTGGRSGATVLTVLFLPLMLLIAGCSSETPAYSAHFSEIGETPMIEQGQTKEGMTTTFEFEVNRTNISKVTFSLAWVDDSGDGCEDLLEITVVSASPSADYQPSQTLQGTSPLELAAIVEPLPEVKDFDTARERDAYLMWVGSTKGIGDWKVSVTCVSTQPDCPDPKAADSGNGWALTVTVFYFEGKAVDL